MSADENLEVDDSILTGPERLYSYRVVRPDGTISIYSVLAESSVLAREEVLEDVRGDDVELEWQSTSGGIRR